MAWYDKLPFRRRGPVVSVVRLNGVIGEVGGFRKGLTLRRVAPALEAAFAGKRTVAVALVVNSPGGSSVQSDLIQQRIRDLSAEKEIPVYVFCEDVAASGGYWIALAGERIYANASSIIGSIGVISAGFGFADAIEKLGIERRVHASADNKGMLDPFRAEDPKHVAHLEDLLEDVYGQFKDWVRERRGEKLNGTEDDLFSGAFWTGRKALELGLIDELGELRGVMREKFGEKVRFRVHGERRSLLQRLGIGVPGIEARPTDGWAEALVGAVDSRALWGRFGL